MTRNGWSLGIDSWPNPTCLELRGHGDELQVPYRSQLAECAPELARVAPEGDVDWLISALASRLHSLTLRAI